jgi:uncharacterized protein
MIDHVNAFALPARDVRGLAEFYRDKLGFTLKEVSDDFAYLTLGPKGMPGVAIVGWDGFSREIAEERARPRDGPAHRSYFAVFVEDADRLHEELSRKGVHFVTPPTTRPGGQRFAFFEDPEGNLWEISHFPKK